jgi:hypothetical protein
LHELAYDAWTLWATKLHTFEYIRSSQEPMLLHFCSATLAPDKERQKKLYTLERDAQSKAAVQLKLKAARDAEISTAYTCK